MAAVRIFTFLVAAAVAQEVSEQALGQDDECSARGDCAQNALQLKGLAMEAGLDESENVVEGDVASSNSSSAGCEDCMMNNGEGVNDAVLGSGMRIWHYAQNCWYRCGRKSGYCPNFCGPGNACCRYRYGGPPECENVAFWPAMAWHTCVMGTSPSMEDETGPDDSDVTITSSTAKDDEGLYMKKRHPLTMYRPTILALSRPSDAPLLSFYVYRAMSDNSYPMENVNAASAGGVMWYLHNEVIIFTPRKFSISRIVRFKVEYRAPKPLYDKGMNFGVRYAYDSGKCTGPGNCGRDYDKYGYFVGCNNVFEYPTAQFSDAKYYPNAVWYAFPGPCFDHSYKQHSDWCVRTLPGGACPGTPDGKGDCTYSYEPKGFVTVDEVVGMTDYFAFLRKGGKEYVPGLGYGSHTCREQPWTCDKGIKFSFWNGKHDESYNKRRVQRLLDAFQKKYPDEPFLQEAPCDFKQWHFYH